KQGLWLTLKEARLELSFLPLLKKRIVIDELALDTLNIPRLPVLPPSEPKPEPEPSEPLAFTKGFPNLPGIEIKKLSLANITLGPAVLGLPPSDPPAILSLQGHVGTASANGLHTLITLLTGGKEPYGDTLRLEALLSEGARPNLQLNAAFDALPGGLVSRLSGLGGPKPLSFSLEGSAPLSDWQGKLRLLAGNLLAMDGTASFALPDSGGQELGLNLRLTPEKNAPAALHDNLGKETNLTVKLAMRPDEAGVPLLTVDGPFWSVRGERIALQGPGMDPKLAGTLAIKAQKPSQGVQLPFAEAGANAVLGGTLNAPSLNLQATLRAIELAKDLSRPNAALAMQAGMDGKGGMYAEGKTDFTNMPVLPGGKDTLTFKANAAREGEGFALREFALKSSLASADLSGAWSPKAPYPGVQGRLKAAVPSLHNLCALFGVQGIRSGALSIQGDFAPKTSEGKNTASLEGRISAALSNAGWEGPLQPLEALLGAAPALTITLHGEPPKEEKGGAPSLEIQSLRLQAAGINAEGRGRFTASETPAFDAGLSASLRELASLVPNASGPLNVRVTAKGSANKPSITCQADSPALTLNNAKLLTPSVQATADLDLANGFGGSGALRLTAKEAHAPLSLSLNWKAGGNRIDLSELTGLLFGVALNGKISASLPQNANPAIEGTLDARVKNWDALSALAGPIKAKNADLALRLSPNAGQSANVKLTLANLLYNGISLKDLNLNADAQNLFSNPRATAKIALDKAQSGEFTIAKAACAANWADNKGAVTLSAQGDAMLDAALSLAGDTLDIQRFKLTDKAGKQGLQLAAPAQIRGLDGSAISTRNLTMRILPQGSLSASAEVKDSIHALLDLKDVPLALARPFAGHVVPDGTLSASAAIQGKANRPDVRLNAALDNVGHKGDGFKPLNAVFTGHLPAGGSALTFSAKLDGIGSEGLTAQGSLPISYGGGFPSVSMTSPVNITAHWDGLIAPLWRFVPMADTRLTGSGRMDAAVRGTLSAPVPTLDLHLKDLRFMDIRNGIELSGLLVDANLANKRFTFSTSGGDGNKGTMSIKGQVNLAEKDMPLQAAGTISNFAPLHRNDLRLKLDGNLNVSGTAAAPNIRADITIPSGELLLDKLSGGSFTTLDVENMEESKSAEQEAKGNDVGKLAVRVLIPGRFFVRGHGLESEWKGDIRVNGALNDPAVTGSLESVRGAMSLLGKSFVLAKGKVLFNGSKPPTPILDVSVQRRTSDIITEAAITGTANAPHLELRSQPPLPKDEVVSRMLFGRPPSELSRAESIQLAASVAALTTLGTTGSGIFDFTRNTLGVDVVRVGSSRSRNTPDKTGGNPLAGPSSASGEDTEHSVLEMGKYIRDDVYVGVQQGIGSDSTEVFVDIEVTPQISMEARTSGEASEVGINWKKEY
ncbi:MAG: translocation/assembly module TamB domain-containing protein, partial [Desulfovibrionaceae bacterium]|nr:translocation/assembly module TamB domain-containing protein [Desulfovibrionaceae bacterium]